MQEQASKINLSGIVTLRGDEILWDKNNENILRFDTNDIAIIGEYTNSDGPYLDDWFLSFVTKDGNWLSIPFYADNIDELLQHLSYKFNDDFTKTSLTGSTEWRSIVHYPKYLKGKALFILTPSDTYKLPKNSFEKILASLGFGNFDTSQNITLTQAVKNELAKASN